MNLTVKDFILLIPCYNDYDGLIQSVNSVHYPKSSHEILIVDDGSDVPLNQEDIQNKYPETTIQLIRINTNKGVSEALNTGLKVLHARNDYKYIARLDCGDICHADRFTKQVAFLDEHKETGLLGTWCRFIKQSTGKYYLYKTKTRYNDILKEMHFKCSFIHPTVMFRKEILDEIGYYPNEFAYAEDYVYFWQILKKYKGEILAEVLVYIEYSSNSISVKNYKKQLKSRMRIVIDFGDNLFLKFLGVCLIVVRYLIPRK